MPTLLVETPEVEGAPLHVITHGRGPTMLVLHGGLGLEHTYLRPGLDSLAGIAQLAYLDIRGNGRSRDIATESTPLTMDRLVADVEAVRSALDSEQLFLVGHSFGSAIAQEYALAHPGHLAGLVLCSGYADFDVGDVPSRAASRRTRAAREAFTALLDGAATTDEEFGTIFRAAFPLYCHQPHAAPVQVFDDWRPCLLALTDSTRLMSAFSTRGRLASLRVPTLIIAGVDDFMTPLELCGSVLAREIADAKLVVFEESGHFPFLEEPARFDQVMREWLAGVCEEAA
jgi:proline iminopeptidase